MMRSLFGTRGAAAGPLDKGAYWGRIGSMRERKKAKRRKIGLYKSSNSGINARIMRAIPLPAAMNTYRQQTT